MMNLRLHGKPVNSGFHLLTTLVLALCAGMMISCVEKPTVDEYDETHSATITTNRSTFETESDSTSFAWRVKSTYKWRIVVPEDATWITVSPTKGDSSGTFTKVMVSIAINTSTQERSALLTMESGSQKSILRVTQACASKTISPGDIDVSRIYIPQELRSNDFYKSSSAWYYGRSKQSDHFIIFWGTGPYWDEYGNVTPTDAKSATYQVNIDDMLLKAESFYKMNIDILGFAQTGNGKSYLDKYKMMIFLNYSSEWLATGAGYDNVIGALWVNPSSCQPVGSTIAHEIGHSFQYQVYADKLLNGASDNSTLGFRYGIGQGCGFWEQCAQWQSYQKFTLTNGTTDDYIGQMFDTENFSVFKEDCHRHFLHEHQRYASYFFQWYWVEKYGQQAVSQVWRESVSPQDPCEAYMAIHGLSNDQFNAQIYDYAAKCVTWDFPVSINNTKTIKDYGANSIGSIGWESTKTIDGFYKVAYSKCPEATGFNHIRLNIPKDGNPISVDFVGLPGASGYNAVGTNAPYAGWTCGFVSLLKDGSVVYSDPTVINSGNYKATLSYAIPANTSKLWMVVAATPTKYLTHLWDEDDTNDTQWPYEVKFSNTSPFGTVIFDGTETPHDIAFSFDVSFPTDASGYSGTTVALGDELIDLAYAFVMQPTEIVSNLGLPSSTAKIKFYGVNADGSLYATTTANGYGHWFNVSGNVCSWGDTGSRVFSEFAESTYTFSIGQYPARCAAGDKFTIKQALVYSKGAATYKATFTFNITIK
jgi:hypothetical protein